MGEWTKEEHETLRLALQSMEPSDIGCWEAVARHVGRSAAECSARWFADFDASEAESMSRKESRKAEKIAMRRAEDAVTAVNSAARAVAIAQHTEKADITELRKARNKLKRAVKGLSETAENAPRILKHPSVDVFKEVHQGPTEGGSALERALRSAAASASPEHVGFKRRRLETKEETMAYNPSRAYLDALRKGRPRAAPRAQPKLPMRMAPGRSYNAREIDRDASCAIHLRDGKTAFTVHDEDLDEEEHLDDLVGSRPSLDDEEHVDDLVGSRPSPSADDD